MILRGDAGRRRGAEIGQRDRQQRAIDHAADQIAEEHPGPVASMRLARWRRCSSHGSGSRPKLPVTRSRPSSTMRMRPTGKISAPTSGWPVCTVPVKARLVAAAEDAAGKRAADDAGRRATARACCARC